MSNHGRLPEYESHDPNRIIFGKQRDTRVLAKIIGISQRKLQTLLSHKRVSAVDIFNSLLPDSLESAEKWFEEQIASGKTVENYELDSLMRAKKAMNIVCPICKTKTVVMKRIGYACKLCGHTLTDSGIELALRQSRVGLTRKLRFIRRVEKQAR